MTVHSPPCPTEDNGRSRCAICEWGADVCSICKEAEGGLAEICPGPPYPPRYCCQTRFGKPHVEGCNYSVTGLIDYA